MLDAGERFENPRTGAWTEVVEAPAAPGVGPLEVRRLMRPRTGRNLPHVHQDYRERFVIEQGRATVKLGRSTHVLEAGESLTVEIGQAHVNAYNAGPEDLVLRHVLDPASAFALGYAETLGISMRESRVDRQGELPMSAVFALAHATGSRTFAVGTPPAVQRRLAFPLGAAIARLRGHEVRLPEPRRTAAG